MDHSQILTVLTVSLYNLKSQAGPGKFLQCAATTLSVLRLSVQIRKNPQKTKKKKPLSPIITQHYRLDRETDRLCQKSELS